jgi:hypothetical protein
MSHGFYRLPPGASAETLAARILGRVQGSAPAAPAAKPFTDNPPKVADTLLADPRAQGYSGDICTKCQGTRLRWAGHCQVCDDCGTTTGCS